MRVEPEQGPASFGPRLTSRLRQGVCLAFAASLVALGLLLAFGAEARSQQADPITEECAGSPLGQVFLPWEDESSYALLSGGSFEEGEQWALAGGAYIDRQSSPYSVEAAKGSHSLRIPAASSAESAANCLADGDAGIRLFVRNTGSSSSLLAVEAIFRDAEGEPVVEPIGEIYNAGSWRPSPTLALPSERGPSFSLRFTPQGEGGEWAIDDVYVSFPSPIGSEASTAALSPSESEALAAIGPCGSFIPGTVESEILTGDNGSDLIEAQAGEDVIDGKTSSDCLRGQAVGDLMSGGGNDDDIRGQAGPDAIYAVDASADAVDCGDHVDRAVVNGSDSTLNCNTNTYSSSDCRPEDIGTRFTMAVKGCRTVWGDTGTTLTPPDPPDGLWGVHDFGATANASCFARDQIDPVPGEPTFETAGGTPQSSGLARQLTVRTMDWPTGMDPRCELGRNSQATGRTVLYREAQRRITYFSIYLPETYPLSSNRFQVVMQMKQTAPADNQSGTPVLSLHAQNNEWTLWQSDSADFSDNSHSLAWSAPATKGVWTRFALDVTYSTDPAQGRVKLYADLNPLTSAADWESPTFNTYTLKREIAGTSADGLNEGDPIPSHLRMGIYHDESIPCPGTDGCSVIIDNVQGVDGG
jgi:hypothetical protein